MTQSKRQRYINSLEEKKYNVSEAMEFIQDRMRRTKTNDEFMETMSQ